MKEIWILMKDNHPSMATASVEVARLLMQKNKFDNMMSVVFMNRGDDKDYLELSKSTVESLDKKKKILRSWYKKYKVGMIKWEQIPKDQQDLLIKYYGVFGTGGN